MSNIELSTLKEEKKCSCGGADGTDFKFVVCCLSKNQEQKAKNFFDTDCTDEHRLFQSKK
jgi:hypothetical protein